MTTKMDIKEPEELICEQCGKTIADEKDAVQCYGLVNDERPIVVTCTACWKIFGDVGADYEGKDVPECLDEEDRAAKNVREQLPIDFYMVGRAEEDDLPVFDRLELYASHTCAFCTSSLEISAPTNAAVLEHLIGTGFDLKKLVAEYGNLEFAVACECAKRRISKEQAVAKIKLQRCRNAHEALDELLEDDDEDEAEAVEGMRDEALKLAERLEGLADKLSERDTEVQRYKTQITKLLQKGRDDLLLSRQKEQEEGEPEKKKKKKEDD